MKKPLLIAFASSLYILALTGCGDAGKNALTEGTIEYDAVVVDQTHPMANLAPNKMSIKFKDNKSCAEMSAAMGLFSTSFISDPDSKSMIQLVKFLNKKFSLVQKEADIRKENSVYTLEITPAKATKMIAGYKCRQSHVKVKGGASSDYEFDVFYTTELGIKNPNFANPYYMIDGVLMEYQLKKFGLEMRFTAKSVKKEDVDDSNFEIPADYKGVSQKEMNELFLGLQ